LPSNAPVNVFDDYAAGTENAAHFLVESAGVHVPASENIEIAETELGIGMKARVALGEQGQNRKTLRLEPMRNRFQHPRAAFLDGILKLFFRAIASFAPEIR
jgi:hypothetical protein